MKYEQAFRFSNIIFKCINVTEDYFDDDNDALW